MRPARPSDLFMVGATRRRQRVLRLNPPYSLIQPQALLPELMRAQLPIKSRVSFVFVYQERGTVLGYVQAKSQWGRRDEWTVTTLGTLDRAPTYVAEALLAEVCRMAGEQGVLRVFAKVPLDEPRVQLFRGLGFTHYTNERIWGNIYFAAEETGKHGEPPHDSLRKQTNTDAWDLMQLYSAVTPPAVQRAEALNSRYWRKSALPRPLALSRGPLEDAYVWPDIGSGGKKGGLGGYIEMLTGSRGHWVTTVFRPDAANRSVCPQAFDFMLWKAARYGSNPVYCGVRDYQADVEGLLEDRGFHPLSEQALLVKYLARPIEVRQPALAPFLARNTGELVTAKMVGE